MAASAQPLETQVTYEELADLERDFEHVEIQIIRRQVELTRPLYEKREKTVSQIPNFWPLVFEQAPPDIDEYIQPQDSALLLSSLTSFSVSHFEIEDSGDGDPRSVSIKFEFSPNDHFEDKVIEKKFWFRRSNSGWAGLVSEPVEIKWKKGKDLTDGILSLAKRVWDEEQAADASGTKKPGAKAVTANQKALRRKIEATGVGATSFFAWFGYTGKAVSAKESQIATEREKEIRQLRSAGKDVPAELRDEEEEDEDDESLDVFPDGDNLAVAITDDLWPGAIKYFTQAQEQDPASDDEFESDAEGTDGEERDGEESPSSRPTKKRKI